MALELTLAPVMIPITLAESLLCHFHRQSSRYAPRIIPLDSSRTQIYAILPTKLAEVQTTTTTTTAFSKVNDVGYLNVNADTDAGEELAKLGFRGLLEQLFPHDHLAFDVIDINRGIPVYQFRQSSRYSHAAFDLIKLPIDEKKNNKLAESTTLEELDEEDEEEADVESSACKSDLCSSNSCDESHKDTRNNNTAVTVSKTQPEDLVAKVKAGMWSKVETYQLSSTKQPQFYLGVNSILHQSDFLDNYRLFTLSDGTSCQWTKRGRFLEQVSNLGQRESEVRKRCGRVVLMDRRNLSDLSESRVNALRLQEVISQYSLRSVVGASKGGYILEVDENDVCLEVALTTSFASFLDHWNTIAGVGGVYYPLKTSGSGNVPWRRITRDM